MHIVCIETDGKREQAFVLQHRQVQLFLNLKKVSTSQLTRAFEIKGIPNNNIFTDHIIPLAYLCTSSYSIYHNSTLSVLSSTTSNSTIISING